MNSIKVTEVAEMMLKELLENLETISDEALMAEWNQAAEDSKDDWMLDPGYSLL